MIFCLAPSKLLSSLYAHMPNFVKLSYVRSPTLQPPRQTIVQISANERPQIWWNFSRVRRKKDAKRQRFWQLLIVFSLTVQCLSPIPLCWTSFQYTSIFILCQSMCHFAKLLLPVSSQSWFLCQCEFAECKLPSRLLAVKGFELSMSRTSYACVISAELPTNALKIRTSLSNTYFNSNSN